MGRRTQATVAPRSALGHRDFRLHLASQFVATLGFQMLSLAVGWQVYALTHRPLNLGLIGLIQFVPAFGFSLLAGHVADRFDRARIVGICNLVLAACAVALFALATRTPSALNVLAGLGPVYLAFFLVGVARAFSGPAGRALAAGLFPAEQLSNAVTWGSTTWQLSTIVGPSLGGALYGASHGATWVYAVCAALLALGAT